MDVTVRQAITSGMDAVRAIRLATWNAADYWRLDGWGAVAPGFRANLVVLDDLETVRVGMTLYEGRVVARAGALLDDLATASEIPAILRDTMHPAPLSPDALRLAPEQARQAVGVIPGEIATRLLDVEPVIRDGWAVAAPERDLLKLICVERHKATGRVGVGYVQGFGLKRGALASSISHDAHNIVAVGASDDDLLLAVITVAASGGGLAAVADGKVLAQDGVAHCRHPLRSAVARGRRAVRRSGRRGARARQRVALAIRLAGLPGPLRHSRSTRH